MSLGKYQFSKKTVIITAIIITLIVCLFLYMGSQSTPAKTVIKSNIITVTIEKSVGIDRIIYENINVPGEGKTLTLITLPYSFNVTRGDTLYFYVSTREGYQWDTWDFTVTGRSNTDNPLWIASDDTLYCYSNKISMTPSCIALRVSPTATPTPSPSPTETPVQYTQLIVVK